MNLLNVHDLIEAYQLARSKGLRWLVKRLPLQKTRRISAAWNTKAPKREWPVQLTRAANATVSNDPDVGANSYFAKKHFSDKSNLLAISFGCGTGENELEWGAHPCFAQVKGIDVASERIRMAQQKAIEQGLDRVVEFELGDLYTTDFPSDHFDLVMFHHSLHHLKPVDKVLKLVKRILKPEGLLFVSEFVGPTRFQWTDKQLAISNAILALLPERYRLDENGFIKKHVHRPGLIRMHLSDPSEAVDSARIRPLLYDLFEPIEVVNLGNTLTRLVFNRIQHNFSADDPLATEYIELATRIEEMMIRTGELQSDDLVGLFRNQRG